MELTRTLARLAAIVATQAVAAAAVNGPLPGFNNDELSTRFAAFSVINVSTNIEILPGSVNKHPTPLFTGTEQWEHDINNGYSSVLYDHNDTLGLGRYRVYYSAGDPSFGGSIPGESSGSATLYATSDDGLTWDKPHLGLFSYKNSTQNNILFDGTTAVAVYDDLGHDTNASSRFKVWGNLPGLLPGDDGRLGYTAQLGGSAVSADGITWTDYRRLQNPSSPTKVRDTWRFDAQASLFFDPSTERYVGTMRAFRPCANGCGECPIWWQPDGGCQGHLSHTCTALQCNRTVRAIGTSTSSSSDFATCEWGANVEVHRAPAPTTQLYSQVSFPFYNIYLGIVMTFAAADPHNVFGRGKVHCELAWSKDGKSYERFTPDKPWIPHGRATTPGADDNAFDSHICFASALPIKLDDQVRVFYMGGDGPHYSPPLPNPLHRNSSFGLVSLGMDRFVAVRAAMPDARGVFTTSSLRITGPRLVVTADTDAAGARISVTVLIIGGASVACSPLYGENVTDAVLAGCEDLPVERQTSLKIVLEGAAHLYTFGFQSE